MTDPFRRHVNNPDLWFWPAAALIVGILAAVAVVGTLWGGLR